MKPHLFMRITWMILTLFFVMPLQAQTAAPRYRVAACDWMMLKRQKLGEFKLAREIGADGVEVDMGGAWTKSLI